MITAAATDIQNNLGKYLHMVQAGGEVVITKNCGEVARLVSREKKRILSDRFADWCVKGRLQ